MKKIFLAVVLAFCGFNYASAQHYQTEYDYEYYHQKPYEYDYMDVLLYGKAGGSGATITKQGGDIMWGPAGGFGVELYFRTYFSMAFEAFFSHKGGSNIRHSGYDTNYDYRLDYFTTSYLAKYFVTKNVAVYSGLGFSTLLNAKSETMGQSSNIKDNLHGAEFVLPVGAELLLNNHFTVDLRWNWSPRPLAKTDKGKSILGKSRNQYLALTVGYKFQVF